MMTFSDNFGQVYSSRDSSVSSSDPLAQITGATGSSWPNVAAPWFTMARENSALWDGDLETPYWRNDKVESPLWDKDMQDPACNWDIDLSHQLAAKLLMIDEQPANQLFMDQSMLGYNSFFGQEISMPNNAVNPRFKTEICRNYKEKGTCLYGELCQFAHGKHELRKDVVRHNKYKTKLCQKYWIAGYCAYGPRCNFIHQEKEGLTALPLQAQEMVGGIPRVASGFVGKTTLYRTAADVIGLANARKSSLGESAGSSSEDDAPSKAKALSISTMIPGDGDKAKYQPLSSMFPHDGFGFAGYNGQGAGPVGSGRPGMRVLLPGS